MMRKSRRERTEVSCVIKYLVFGFNVLFWLLGGALLAIGIWAWSEKEMFQKFGELTKFPLDPALIFIIVGLVIFKIGFCGCIGALRENQIFLLIYCIAIGILFFVQLVAGILAFIYKDWLRDTVQKELKVFIRDYREDPDLQNLIDWVQMDWLKCCGIEGYNDWDMNIYFNCTSPSRERCGVPFSCCKPLVNEVIQNKQCGYDARREGSTSIDRIFSTGCLAAAEKWLNDNLIPVAAVIVGVALVQILGICFAQNLRSDIFAQKAKWR